MHPVLALERLGGVSSRGSVEKLSSRADLDRALRCGDIERDAHGRLALPGVDAALRTASSLTGVVSHTSAARIWGWELKNVPELPHVTVPRNRRVPPERRRTATVHWADLAVDDVRGTVASKVRTLTDCMSSLPFEDALAVCDSALRHGDISSAALQRVAQDRSGPGSARARLVAAHADHRAANPFESVLRAISRGVPGLHLIPQVPISWTGFYARPDLVDEGLGLVVEADSHTWHSSRDALRRDCRRYNALTLGGWMVLRFTWEDVMFRGGSVLRDLAAAVEHAQRRQMRRTAP